MATYIITERQFKMGIEYLVRESFKRQLEEARLKSLSEKGPNFYVFTECQKPTNYLKHYVSKISPSEYFLTSQIGRTKNIVRKSNHWSQYLITGYFIPHELLSKDNIYRNTPVNLVFGTQQQIKSENNNPVHFSIKLGKNYANNIPIDVIKNALNGRDKNGNSYLYRENGIHFLSLDSNTLGLKDKVDFYGSIMDIPRSDYNLFNLQIPRNF